LLAEEFEVAVSLLQHFSFEHLFRRENVRLLLDLHERQGEGIDLRNAAIGGFDHRSVVVCRTFRSGGRVY
jgi:hypothetical protein